jgi:hypothetical protein
MVSEFRKGCVELFSGNADITKALIDKGVNCVSVDYDPNKKPMLCCDVYKLTDEFLKQFSFIWLSPDCTTYSLASHGIHRRRGGLAVSDYAKECDNNNTALFEQLKRLNIPFIAENPRAHFRNMPFVNGLYRKTVYYSTYGMNYAKPTDLFSNRAELLEVFNPEYIKGSKHLDCISYNDFLGRCKMPPRLIDDICKAVEIAVNGLNYD